MKVLTDALVVAAEAGVKLRNVLLVEEPGAPLVANIDVDVLEACFGYEIDGVKFIAPKFLYRMLVGNLVTHETVYELEYLPEFKPFVKAILEGVREADEKGILAYICEEEYYYTREKGGKEAAERGVKYVIEDIYDSGLSSYLFDQDEREWERNAA